MKHFKLLLLITLTGLLLRVGYAVSIYEPSLLPVYLDDFTSYRNAAIDILQGDLAFTNSLYLKRPPGFSLLAAALGIQPILIIAVNILLGAAIIPLTYVLARHFVPPPDSSQKLALLAACIVAIDPTSIRYSSVLLAEPLANLLLAFGFISLIALKQAGARRTVMAWGLLAGGFIILSALTRPAAYLLWIPMAVWVAFARQRWRALAVVSLVTLAFSGMMLWKQHNATYLRNSSFTTIGTFNLLYYRAASALHQATQQDINTVYATLAGRVEAKLGNNAPNITRDRRWHHRASPAQMESMMTEVALDVFREYPLYYLLTIPVGLYRTLLEIWTFPIWISISWNAVFLLAAAYGLWQFVRQRHWVEGLFLLLPCAYFLAGTLLVMTASIDTRARVMVTPLLAVMAAHGAVYWLNRRRAASAPR